MLLRLGKTPSVALAALVLGAALNAEDILTEARALATSHQREKSLQLLQQHLQGSPNDVDARLLYGLVLSWEFRFDAAREALDAVLAGHPSYADAAVALTNVELWSDHAERAEVVTREFLEREPNNITVLMARVRVMRALKRSKDAVALVGDILHLDPQNVEAHDLRRAFEDEQKHWEASYSQSSTWYSDGGSTWQERSLSLRHGSSAGSAILRLSNSQHFGYNSNLVEAEWYPHIRPGTYGWLNAGYSPDGNLYPTYRLGADLFQNLGRGFEASAGMRDLFFSSGQVRIYTASLGRYHKNWYFSGRTFVTPGAGGPSASLQLQARRYFGDGQRYVSVGYGHGASPFEVRSTNEIGVLNSHSYTGSYNWLVRRHWILYGTGSVAYEDRVERLGVSLYYLSFGLYYRF